MSDTKKFTAEEINAAIHDLRVLHGQTTKGEWQKGKTTHETVSVGGDGKHYHIASFRHADDAAFLDVAHKYILPILDELEQARAALGITKPKAEVLIDDEAIEKRVSFPNRLETYQQTDMKNNTYPALFPPDLTEKIALEIIEEESNMGFSTNGAEPGLNWGFSVCSEPTLLGLEAVLYVALLNSWEKTCIEELKYLTIKNPGSPYGYTPTEAAAFVKQAEKNGFEFNGVSTSKGGRCWCSEIQTIPLLRAVLTLINEAMVKEGVRPTRLTDEIKHYINPDKEVTGE